MLLILSIEIGCWRPPLISLLTFFLLSAPHTPLPCTSTGVTGLGSYRLHEGVQQGDPLRPLLFCLTLHQFCQCLLSALSISYSYDVTTGGSCFAILQDLEVVKEAEDIGLTLNSFKWEIIIWDHTTFDTTLTSLPGVHLIGGPCTCLSFIGFSTW